MKHKLLTAFLALLALVCLCFGLVACGGSDEKGNSGSSDTEQGGGQGSEEQPSDPEPHDHVYGADNLCTVCGDKWEYTEGLTFTLSADRQSYLVSGAGTAKGNIVIPFGYQGKFVTGIADSAFANATLTGVELPSSVTSIGKNAFFGSTLASVTLPATLTAIGESAFDGCTLLITVNIADLAAWFRIQFANGTANPLSQAQRFVVGGEEVTELVIPKSVTKLNDYAFYGCDFLTSIVIPESVTSLGTLVFGNFTVTVIIRFEGTVEEWQELIEGLLLWESGKGNPVNCENGSIDKDGNVTTPPGGEGGQGGEGGDTPGGEHTHIYSETWSYDEDSHWHEATCHPAERNDEAPHTYENGVCKECHYAHENHTYENGVCTECDFAHQNHTYENGVCTECDFVHTDHAYTYSEKNETGHTGTCSVCGKTVTGEHSYENGQCTECEYEHVGHTFTEYTVKNDDGHTGTCSVCGKTVTGEHSYEKGQCTECEYGHESHTCTEYTSKNAWSHTGVCSICGKTVSEGHSYENGQCAKCEYEHVEHSFNYSEKNEEGHTGTCSLCYKVVTEGHTYEEGWCTDCGYEHVGHSFTKYTDKTETEHRKVCLICGKSVIEEHTYSEGVCTECNYEHEGHIFTEYTNKTEVGHSGTCSVCNKFVTEEEHNYENGKCTKCEYEHKNHTYGENGTCEVCGTKPIYTMSEDGTKIYFGEYPQTEVKESGLKGMLGMEAGATPTSENEGKWTDYDYYISGKVQSFMWYIDVKYQGNRYRGVYFSSYRPYGTEYESSEKFSAQDDNGYNTNTVYWFKYEPIEWRILEQKNGTAYLMANIILDSQQYYHTASHTPSSTRTVNGKTVYENNYKESDIRVWLNDAFYKTAFAEPAKQIIETTTVDNSESSTGGRNSYACENTQDKVFLLSSHEVINIYGFNAWTIQDPARELKSTDYAKIQGISVDKSGNYLGNGWWWLRSPFSSYSFQACGVDSTGKGGFYPSVSLASGGVVPAIWIRL